MMPEQVPQPKYFDLQPRGARTGWGFPKSTFGWLRESIHTWGLRSSGGGSEGKDAHSLHAEWKAFQLTALGIATDGLKVLLFLLFESLTILFLRNGPFEELRPLIEPLLKGAALVLVGCFCCNSISQYLTFYVSDQRGKAGGTISSVLVTVLALGLLGGAMHFISASKREQMRSAKSTPPGVVETKSHEPRGETQPAILRFTSATRVLSNGRTEKVASLVFRQGQEGVVFMMFIAFQPSMEYSWKLDGKEQGPLEVFEDGTIVLYCERSKLSVGKHQIAIRCSPEGKRRPELYDFLVAYAN